MDKLDQIQRFKDRAYAIQSMGEWSEEVEHAFYDLKEDIFKTHRFWELERAPYYWKAEIKSGLDRLSLLLEDVWQKKFRPSE